MSANQIPADQLIKLDDGPREGAYIQLERPKGYPNSVVVDRVAGIVQHTVPIGRDLVYMISNDYDDHGVRLYRERQIDPETGLYPVAINHRPARRVQGVE